MGAPQSQTLLSVRGEASRVVGPDQASVWCSLTVFGPTRAEAAAAAATRLAGVIAALAGLGGVAYDAAGHRSALTWSAQSVQIHDEYAGNPRTGMHGPTGRQQATVTVVVAIRDLALVDRVQEALVAGEGVDITSVQWTVDRDNPAWAAVRADAIAAALVKGQDYAAALGGSVVSVEHVADAGLLGGEPVSLGHGPGGGVRLSRAMAFAGDAGGGVPSLDPVPQELTATIDARFVATVGPLPSR